MFVSVPEGATPAPSSEGHVYTGKIAQGRWVDAGNLVAGYKLLGEDASWSVVVSIEITDTPLEAYNLTVEDFHTYFVKAGTGAGLDAVWVHNRCGPKVNPEPSRDILNQRDDLLSRAGTRIDEPIEFPNGGSLSGDIPTSGSSANLSHELQIALEFAEAGKKVELRGGSGSAGLDLIVDGKKVEVRQVSTRLGPGHENTIRRAVSDKLASATRRAAGSDIVIDARPSKRPLASVEAELQRVVNGSDWTRDPTPVTVYADGKRLRLLPDRPGEVIVD